MRRRPTHAPSSRWREPNPPSSRAGATGSGSANPIVAAYFRATDEPPDELAPPAERPAASPASASAPSAAAPVWAGRSNTANDPESVEAVMELLAEADVTPEPPRALLEAADADRPTGRLALVRGLMADVRDRDETAYLARTRELAFLANTLLAGCTVQSRPFTSQEAFDAAAAVCNLGLECAPTRPRDAFLIDHDLVSVFEAGWSALYHDVSLFVADGLVAALEGLHGADCDIRHDLDALRHALVRQREAGTPWLARGAADVLALLDMTAWVSIVGLLDECPILPAALTAAIEGRTARVNPTAFDFISTPTQIADIRVFVRKLPDLLSR